MSQETHTWQAGPQVALRTHFLCRLRSIAARRDHFVWRLSMILSGSHTFLVVTYSFVLQMTHAFRRMLPLFFLLHTNDGDMDPYVSHPSFKDTVCHMYFYLKVDTTCSLLNNLSNKINLMPVLYL